MNELSKRNLLHLDCMTVNGTTMGENIKNCRNLNPEVIRPVENPYSETGGIAILKHGESILECLRSHDIPGLDIPLHQLHNLHARMFCQTDALRVHRRYGAVAPKSHADGAWPWQGGLR